MDLSRILRENLICVDTFVRYYILVYRGRVNARRTENVPRRALLILI